MTELSERLAVPTENLLTPDLMRRVLWTPPSGTGADLLAAVSAALTSMGARPWQVALTAPVLSDAIEGATEDATGSTQTTESTGSPESAPAEDESAV